MVTEKIEAGDQVLSGLAQKYIGAATRAILKQLSAADMKSWEKISELLDNITKQKTLPIFERIKFRIRMWLENELIDDYVNELRKMAGRCNFYDEVMNMMIIDNVILSIGYGVLNQYLFKQENLKLKELIQEIKSNQAKAVAQIKGLTNRNVNNISVCYV